MTKLANEIKNMIKAARTKASAISLGAGAARSAKGKPKQDRKAQLCDCYAHRGFHHKPDCPENSIAAFRSAIENDFPVELDVHLIADGSLVVFHDEKLERMTGVKGLIEDYSLDSLKHLRLGESEEHIPSFDEVLELFENNLSPSGRICPLLIELKSVNGNYKKLVSRVLDRLESYSGDFVIESFDPRAIAQLRKLRPDIVRGQLSQNFVFRPDLLPFWQAILATNLAFNFMSRPDFIAYKFTDRDNAALRRCVDKKGIKEACWTIRSPQEFKQARREGCSAIFERFDPREIEL